MLQPPTMFEFRRRHTFGFSINWPGDLELIAGWATFIPTLVFLGLFVLYL